MARRSFIFCDICNPLALRAIELRRTSGREHRDGRRLSDGSNAWAKQTGWLVADGGQHILPSCFERMRSKRYVLEEWLFAGNTPVEDLRDEID